MSNPEQPTGHFAGRDEKAAPTRTERRDDLPEGPACDGGPDRVGEWEGYDLAVLDAVLDS
jgi:hypothetical protein